MERRRFCPEGVARLEARLVLSHTVAARGLSAVVSGLTPGQRVLNREQQPIIGEVDQAFSSFSSDYDAARATYFASILNVPNPSTATTNAFTLYTIQRVSLLSEQLTSSILQSSRATARAHGQPNTLEQIIRTKIIGPDLAKPSGQLVTSLLATIPPPGISAPTATLYSSSQDNAIAAAQVAVLNGVSILRNGDFGNQPPK